MLPPQHMQGSDVAIPGGCLLSIVLFSLWFTYVTFNESADFSISSSALRKGGVNVEAQASKSNIRNELTCNTQKVFSLDQQVNRLFSVVVS